MASSWYHYKVPLISVAATAQLIGDVERAQTTLEMILRHNPLCAAALIRLGHLLHNQQQYIQAAEAYQKALAVIEQQPAGNQAATPSLTTIWAALAHCWLLLDDLPRAFHTYQQALSFPGGGRDAALWFGVGVLYDRYGADEHALEAFSAVLKLSRSSTNIANGNGTAELPKVPSPMLREVYFRLGILLRNRKHYAPAIACFEYTAQFPPAPLQRADTKLQLAMTLEVKGDTTAARAVLEQFVVKDSKKAVAARGKALLGWILVRDGLAGSDASAEQEQGLAMLKQVVTEEAAGDALAWYYLGRACLSRGMYTQAYEAYQEAVYRDGQNAAFWNSIGILYLDIRQYRDALDAFSRAINQASNLAEVWWNLGVLYESSNSQLNDALDAYQRAAELATHNTTITSRIALLKGHLANGSTSPPAAPTDIQEVDSLPFLPRPILLGTALIPPQKANAPTAIGTTMPPGGHLPPQSLAFHPSHQGAHQSHGQPVYAGYGPGRMNNNNNSMPPRPMSAGLPNPPVRPFSLQQPMPQLIRPPGMRSTMPSMPVTRPPYSAPIARPSHH
jgi:tetratricopeptide (TPR) repeat protein